MEYKGSLEFIAQSKDYLIDILHNQYYGFCFHRILDILMKYNVKMNKENIVGELR